MTCEEVWANDLSRSRRQNAARRKADGGCAEGVAETWRTERLEQVLPPPRPNRQVHEHRRQRQDQPFRLGVDDLAPDTAQVDVVQDQPQQRHGERQNDQGSQMRSH
jgi:hypothetical protein